ncbi:MAG: hypothetical protein KDK36_15760 [Leptospiraceae bacterium]|nr:hypothetical protein [Leptospiraceae bacterium]
MDLEFEKLTMEDVADFKETYRDRYGEIDSVKIHSFIDSSGLGMLIEIAKYKQKLNQKKLVIRDLKNIQRVIFNLSKLDELFEIN